MDRDYNASTNILRKGPTRFKGGRATQLTLVGRAKSPRPCRNSLVGLPGGAKSHSETLLKFSKADEVYILGGGT